MVRVRVRHLEPKDEPNAVSLGGASVDQITAPHKPGRQQHWAPSVGREALIRLAPAFLFFGFWEFGARVSGSRLIPTASQTAVGIGELLTQSDLWSALWVSNQALFVGYLVAILVGVPTGIVIGRFRAMEKISDVWINIMLVTPMSMITPLIVMALGFGLTARALVIIIFATPMVLVNCRAGIREVRPDLIEMARTFGADEREIWRKILLPSAAPAIWAGFRLALGRAISGMIIVELLLVAVGIGRLILFYKGTFNPSMTYAVVAIVIAESLLLIQVLRQIQRRVVPWAPY